MTCAVESDRRELSTFIVEGNTAMTTTMTATATSQCCLERALAMRLVSCRMERKIRNVVYWPMFWRWRERRRCHGFIRPCQEIDHPMCN